MLMGFSSPAFADITHRMTSSVNLHTGAAYNTAERIGSTYTVSGSGVTMDVAGGVKTLRSTDTWNYPSEDDIVMYRCKETNHR